MGWDRRWCHRVRQGAWRRCVGAVSAATLTTSADPPPGPKILISHIPLARPEASTCGPLRERGRILKGAGPGYQNLLGSETSKFLLEVIKPTLVVR